MSFGSEKFDMSFELDIKVTELIYVNSMSHFLQLFNEFQDTITWYNINDHVCVMDKY